MDTWLKTYGFSIAIIQEACTRTVLQTGQASFQYTDSILTEWNRAGVRTMRDVEEVTRMRKGGGEKGQRVRPVRFPAGRSQGSGSFRKTARDVRLQTPERQKELQPLPQPGGARL